MRRATPQINEKRRTLLKFAAVGAASFMLGKIFGPGIRLFAGDEKITEFNNFRVVENGQELGFYDKLGNEILVMEKGATAGE